MRGVVLNRGFHFLHDAAVQPGDLFAHSRVDVGFVENGAGQGVVRE